MFQEAWTYFTQMGFLCVILLFQISNKSHLKSIDVLDVSKNDFYLVIIEHVNPLSALPQVTLNMRSIEDLHFFASHA